MIFTKLKAFFYVGFLFQAVTIQCNKTTFSRVNAAVVFNPRNPIEETKESFETVDLIPMVSLIASKFSKLSTAIHDETVEEDPKLIVIPSTIAIYNRFHLKTGESPLELSIIYSISNVPNETAIQSSPEGWNSLINILDEANNIYPGTVKRIYIEHTGIMHSIDDFEVTKFENYFATAQFPKSENYELGISLLMLYVDSAGLPNLLEHFRHLSFYWWPNLLENEKNDEPQKAIQTFLEGVSYCKRKIARYRKNVTLRIETGWLWKNPTGEAEHDEKSLRYWGEINDWAETSNTSVLFFEAFDDFDGIEGGKYDHMGLWRLVQNANYKDASEYVFEERGTVHSLSPFSWGLVFFIMFIILAVGLIAGLLFIKYFYPNIFYTKVVPYLPEFQIFRLWVTQILNFCASKL